MDFIPSFLLFLLVFSQHAGSLYTEHSHRPRLKAAGKHLLGGVETDAGGTLLGGCEVIQLQGKHWVILMAWHKMEELQYVSNGVTIVLFKAKLLSHCVS